MSDQEFNDKVKLEYYRGGVDATREVGLTALKTLVTLNSGAFVVLLTFIGNVAATSRYVVPIGSIRFALTSFLVGIMFAFLSMAYTYYASQEMSPYPDAKGKFDGWFVPVVISVTALSFIAFALGVCSIIANVELIK